MNRSYWGLPPGLGAWWDVFTARFRVSTTQYALTQMLLRVESPAPNVDIVIRPTGTGAFQLATSDGTVSGGNPRGSYAADLSMTRTAATQVASGAQSFNAGYANTVSGQYAGAIGAVNTASAIGSFAAGYTNTASGQYSTALGVRASATLYGKYANASGQFSTVGDCQYGRMTLRRQTTDATSTVLTGDGGAASTSNIPVLPNNSSHYFEVQVLGHRTGTSASAAWKLTGLIRRDANAASTAIVGSVTSTTVADGSGGAWSVSATADTTNGGLSIAVVGAAGQNINWLAVVKAAEITG